MMYDEPLIKEIRNEQESLKNSLCQTPVQDYNTYMRLVGRYEGLDIALGLVLAQGKED